MQYCWCFTCCFTKNLKCLLNPASQFTPVEADMFILLSCYSCYLASKGKMTFQYSLDNKYLAVYHLVPLEVYVVMNQIIIVHQGTISTDL